MSKNDYYLFGLKSLLWLFLGWIGFLLTLVGFFHAWLVWGIFFAGMLFLVRYFLKNKSSLLPSTELLVVSITLLLVVIGLSFFTTPTIFSGRDQGSISEAAIRLAQNHTLAFSTPASQAFAQIHGAGRALNFPGFFYNNAGNLVTQFPLVYIAWLASFYGLFGLIGLTIANAVALLWFLLGFYFLSRFFISVSGSVLGIFFVATSLSVVWFPKYTLSENLAMTLLWLSIFALVSFLKKQNKLNFLLLFASSLLLIFTRIEGIAFFLVSLGIILSQSSTHTYLKNIRREKLWASLFFILLILIINTGWELNFYKEIVKALLPDTITPQATTLVVEPDATLPNFYLLQIFNLYGMLGFFGLAAIASLFYAVRKKFFLLLPFFVVMPTVLYFFNAHISADHPWMLRRFAFALLPVAIFYSTLVLNDLKEYFATGKHPLLRIIPALFAILLLLGNLPAFFHFAFLVENKELLPQIEQLSQRFGANDLILVDSLTTGDGWAMATGPMGFLEKKNAVYFFNPNDLSKLKLKNFTNVYLIVPTSRNGFYLNSSMGSLLTPVDKYMFSTSRLNLKKETNKEATLNFPTQQTVTVPLTIFRIQ